VNTKVVASVFYTWIMPSVTVLSLLVVANFVHREMILNSSIVDMVVRVLICATFCYGYIVVGNLDKYIAYFKGNPKVDEIVSQDMFERNVVGYYLQVFIGGVAVILITYWIILKFLPIVANSAWIIGILNGMILSFPWLVEYAKNQ